MVDSALFMEEISSGIPAKGLSWKYTKNLLISSDISQYSNQDDIDTTTMKALNLNISFKDTPSSLHL